MLRSSSTLMLLFLLVAIFNAINASSLHSNLTEPLLSRHARMINGKYVSDFNQFPYSVLLKINDKSYCGGILIDKRGWVLTTASCVAPGQSITAHIAIIRTVDIDNESLFPSMKVKQIHIHPHHNGNSNNIALLELDGLVGLVGKAIELQHKRIGDGVQVTACGFGFQSDSDTSLSPDLKYIEFSTIKNEDCIKNFPAGDVNDGILCANGNSQSICKGDIGGPLVAQIDGKPTLVGISSFIHKDGCTKGKPSGFTRISNYIAWIRAVTKLPL